MSNMATMSDTDVLIIGGGPTGITLALELSMQNIPFRIIDSSPERSDKSRAFAIHARSLELLSRHDGILEDLLKRGTFNLAVKIFSNKKFVFAINLEDTPFKDTVFPGPLIISQAATEEVLDEALLRNYGRTVERPVKAEKVEQDVDGATVSFRHADGMEELVRCKYVVGCDGAHSIVRKLAGLKFEGAAYPQDFILADVHLIWEHKHNLHIFIGHYGLLAVLPMPGGLFRLVCSRPFEANTDTDPTLNDFRIAIERHVPGSVEISDPVWITRFRLHHRIAEKYRSGRLFIAGDAAHIHSPAGGQGMNTGIQDSINLGWKLAHVLRGKEPESLLDTYNLERHKVGKAILQGTDRVFEFMATTNPMYLFLRNRLLPWIVPWIMGNPARRASKIRFISQLGVRYRESPIVGNSTTWKGELRGGNRAADGKLLGPNGEITAIALLKGPGHHLLLFSGVGEDAAGEQQLCDAEKSFTEDGNNEVVVQLILDTEIERKKGYADSQNKLHNCYGFEGPGFALVRPDGYIAFIGHLHELDELNHWLSEH